MTELEKLRIENAKLRYEHANLQGEFIGFLYGLSWWTLPEDLVVRIKQKRKELIEKSDSDTKYFVEL